MTAHVSCSSGPACPVYPDAGRVRAVFARTDLRRSHFRVSWDAMLETQEHHVSYGKNGRNGMRATEPDGRRCGSPYVPMLFIGTDRGIARGTGLPAAGRLQPVCLCLRRGGVYPARRRKAPSIRFMDPPRLSLRQGTACLPSFAFLGPDLSRAQAKDRIYRAVRRFAVAPAFVGAGLIPARRREAPSIRFPVTRNGIV